MSGEPKTGMDEIAPALGYIAIIFSVLEFHIDTIIGYLLGLQVRQKLAVTADLSSIKRQGLLQCAIDAFWTRNEYIKTELKKIVTEFGNARTKRNKYIHGFWFFDKEPYAKHQVISFKAREKLDLKDDKATVVELMDFAVSLIDLQQRIKKFFDETEELPNWDKIYFSPAATASAELMLKQVVELARKKSQNQDGKN